METRAGPDFPEPPGPRAPHTCLCVETTQGRCGSPTRAAAALQQHNRACSCFQQHNEACRCLNQPLQTGQERPKITVSGMNGPKIHPHGLSLCVRGAVGLRMPLEALTGQKTQKIAKKPGFSGSGGSGRGPPRGPACAPLRAALRCGSVRCSLRLYVLT